MGSTIKRNVELKAALFIEFESMLHHEVASQEEDKAWLHLQKPNPEFGAHEGQQWQGTRALKGWGLSAAALRLQACIYMQTLLTESSQG